MQGVGNGRALRGFTKKGAAAGFLFGLSTVVLLGTTLPALAQVAPTSFSSDGSTLGTVSVPYTSSVSAGSSSSSTSSQSTTVVSSTTTSTTTTTRTADGETVPLATVDHSSPAVAVPQAPVFFGTAPVEEFATPAQPSSLIGVGANINILGTQNNQTFVTDPFVHEPHGFVFTPGGDHGFEPTGTVHDFPTGTVHDFPTGTVFVPPVAFFPPPFAQSCNSSGSLLGIIANLNILGTQNNVTSTCNSSDPLNVLANVNVLGTQNNVTTDPHSFFPTVGAACNSGGLLGVLANVNVGGTQNNLTSTCGSDPINVLANVNALGTQNNVTTDPHSFFPAVGAACNSGGLLGVLANVNVGGTQNNFTNGTCESSSLLGVLGNINVLGTQNNVTVPEGFFPGGFVGTCGSASLLNVVANLNVLGTQNNDTSCFVPEPVPVVGIPVPFPGHGHSHTTTSTSTTTTFTSTTSSQSSFSQQFFQTAQQVVEPRPFVVPQAFVQAAPPAAPAPASLPFTGFNVIAALAAAVACYVLALVTLKASKRSNGSHS